MVADVVARPHLGLNAAGARYELPPRPSDYLRVLGQVNAVGKRRCPRAAVAVLAVVITAACGSSEPAAQGTVVSVVESDFEINVQTNVKAGDVALTVHNHGPDDHELIVVPAPDGDLPCGATALPWRRRPSRQSPLVPSNLVRPEATVRCSCTYSRVATNFCNMSGITSAACTKSLVAL